MAPDQGPSPAPSSQWKGVHLNFWSKFHFFVITKLIQRMTESDEQLGI